MMADPSTPSRSETGQSNASAVVSRASLTTLIQAFLDSEITAFEFDERLDVFRESDDPLIQHVVDAVWYYCDDHYVCLSKEIWDYLQRLLLALNSDCRVESQFVRRWSMKQLIAAVCLCGFACLAPQVGWSSALLILAIPFGVVSIALSLWHPNDQANVDPFDPIIFPFASFGDLSATCRSSSYRKTPYPKQVEGRRIRSPFMTAFWQIYAYTCWLILSPLPLLFQMLPETRKWTRIKAA